MSTPALSLGRSPVLDQDRRPSLSRLTLVELRKMVDTRSGLWVSILVALLTLVVAVIASLTHHGLDATLTHTLHADINPAVFLLPMIGVLLVCGEWTQRTTLTTFTLVPSRGRVIVAKLAASVLVSTVATIVCLIFTILGAELLGSHPGGAGGLTWQVIGQSWLYLAASMIMGVAFGAAILVSAPAIVAYLLLPTVWDAVVGGIHALSGLADWLDSSDTLGPLTQGSLSATDWAHVATTLAVWVALPLVIGVTRIWRGDID